MFARITRIHIRTDAIDQAKKLYEESVIPAAKAQRGFQKVFVLIDRKSGEGATITFWKSEEDALANERNLYYQEQLVKFMNFFTSPPVREGYEVIIQA